MIQQESVLQVADNSGAKFVMCIKVIGGSKRRYARVGDVIICAVKEAAPRAKVKKSDICKGIIVRQKKILLRSDGGYIKSDSNAVVLIDNKGEPIGTRVFGPVMRELRQKCANKILSLAPEVL